MADKSYHDVIVDNFSDRVFTVAEFRLYGGGNSLEETQESLDSLVQGGYLHVVDDDPDIELCSYQLRVDSSAGSYRSLYTIAAIMALAALLVAVL